MSLLAPCDLNTGGEMQKIKRVLLTRQQIFMRFTWGKSSYSGRRRCLCYKVSKSLGNQSARKKEETRVQERGEREHGAEKRDKEFRDEIRWVVVRGEAEDRKRDMSKDVPIQMSWTFKIFRMLNRPHLSISISFPLWLSRRRERVGRSPVSDAHEISNYFALYSTSLPSFSIPSSSSFSQAANGLLRAAIHISSFARGMPLSDSRPH